MFTTQLVSGLGLVFAVYYTTSSPSLTSPSRVSPVYVYVAGCITGIFLVPILAYILKWATRYLFHQRDEADHSLYRLDHGVLNVELPPKTMWMNMGYWKVKYILRLAIGTQLIST
jgi:hypothetical protein